jgi:ABC-2 type transport system ATP-binding protein
LKLTIKVLNSIETKSLSKSFGDLKAVDDISFNVENGEIFGFLGPNGAGKSTTMMILTTLLKPTSGQALVSGFDVKTNPKQVRQKIGYVQQESTVDEYLTGRENLLLQARLNHIPKDLIQERIDEVLDLIETKRCSSDIFWRNEKAA